MNKHISKIITIITLSLLFSLLPATTASAKTVKLPDKVIYLNKYDSGAYTEINPYTSINETIETVTNVKSSNKKIISSIYTSSYEYYDQPIKFYCNVLKAGTVTLNFDAGKNTYKQKITVKKYVNPLSKLTINTVNKGKNLASKLDKKGSLSLYTNTTKTVRINVTAKKDWKIQKIRYKAYQKDDKYTLEKINRYHLKVSSAVLTFTDDLLANSYPKYYSARAYIYMVNTKNNGEICIPLYISPNK